MPISNVRLRFPESLGLLGLVGLIGIIGYMTDWNVLRPWLAAFAAFSLIGLRFFHETRLKFPERLGLFGFLGFLGFLGFIPGAESLKAMFGFFGFGFFHRVNEFPDLLLEKLSKGQKEFRCNAQQKKGGLGEIYLLIGYS